MLCRTTVCRTIAIAATLLSVTLPASALSLNKPADEALSTASARMKAKDYAGAREAALKSGDTGARPFLVGISCVRLELWEEAASQLAVAAESYPLLADYALYYQGLALSKLVRLDQALPPLYRLLKQYPESRLARAAMILYADTLAAGGYPKEALESYARFIERYPSGGDSLSALLGSALCRERLGDPAAAAAILRGVWLNNPASPTAEKAAQELNRIAAAGTRVEPYTVAELFKRGGTLYDLGRYAQAATTYQALPLGAETGEFAAKVRLKTGQALFKARHYQESEQTLRGVDQNGAGGGSSSEASYWLAKALDKNGKTEQAYELYLRVAQAPQSGAVADDALLDAAYLKRYQKKWDQSLQLFKKYLTSRPEQQQSAAVIWEAAWTSYQSRDYPGASSYLRKLAGREEMREKALYWLGKTQLALGDAKGAEGSFAALAEEYPFGYYALICNRWCDIGAFPIPPQSLAEALPMPAGFEREKALISLGLLDEAARELGAKKNKNPLSIARLFLEMDNYNGALHAVAKEKPKRADKESGPVWGVNYPLAYREDVARNAAANALPESLIYAIMRAESNYFPAALSPVGAVGLMQIMPATAESISKGDSVRLTRPELNIRLGARHLKDLMVVYDRNIPLAVAAYNAGSGNVKRWQKSLAALPQDEFIESIPFRETREYVKKVVSTMELYQRLYRFPTAKKLGFQNMTTEGPKGT
jgi:soluble lytic murein transglycosylase